MKADRRGGSKVPQRVLNSDFVIEKPLVLSSGM